MKFDKEQLLEQSIQHLIVYAQFLAATKTNGAYQSADVLEGALMRVRASHGVASEQDLEAKYEAMKHLEYIDWTTSQDEAVARSAAAHYLIQSMFNGSKPENYDEVIAAANAWSGEVEPD